MVGKTHLHLFFQHKRWILKKKIHYFLIYQKVLLLLGSNFPVMFMRWLSTAFLSTPCLGKDDFSIWLPSICKKRVVSHFLILHTYQLNSSPTFQLPQKIRFSLFYIFGRSSVVSFLLSFFLSFFFFHLYSPTDLPISLYSNLNTKYHL